MYSISRIQGSFEYSWIIKLLTELDAQGYKAICAGGFPRDVSLGESYNDIDIFVQTKTEGEEDKVNAIMLERCGLPLGIQNRIQLICVPCDDIVEYIEESFDFTCCLIHFDKSGGIRSTKAALALNTKTLRFVDRKRDSFTDLKSIRHCMRLLNRGWFASYEVTKAIVKTLVPVVGSITYDDWREHKELLTEVLEEEFHPPGPEHRSVVPIREYGEVAPPPPGHVLSEPLRPGQIIRELSDTPRYHFIDSAPTWTLNPPSAPNANNPIT